MFAAPTMGAPVLDALPGLGAPVARRDGALYRGTCAQIAQLVQDGRVDMARQAGLVAAARLLAHQIDLAGGHGPAGKREPYALAQLLREYRVFMAELEGVIGDDLPAWLSDDDAGLDLPVEAGTSSWVMEQP